MRPAPTLVALAVFARLIGAGRTAHADPETETRSYAEQTLAADVGAFAIGAPLTRVNAIAGRDTTFGLFAIAAPVVHLGHHRPGHALLSFAVRMVTPAVFLGVEQTFATTKPSDLNVGKVLEIVFLDVVDDTKASVQTLSGSIHFDGWVAASVFSGMAIASAIDAAIFAREPVSACPPAHARGSWTPVPLLGRGTAGVSLVGTF